MKELMSIQELRDEYVICRTLGHSWEENPGAPMDDTLLAMSDGGLALRCTRCTTERLDYIGNDMRVAWRYYKYPQHYTTIPGEGSRPNLRGELFRRSLLIRSVNSRKKRSR